MGIMEILATICGILFSICYVTFFAAYCQSDNKIAQRIAIISGLCTIMFAILILIFGILCQKNNRYTTTATGVNEVTIRTDDDKVVWRVFNEDIEKGKKYEVTFDTKGTNKITDDEIIEVKEIK
jgi:hypothetical protein